MENKSTAETEVQESVQNDYYTPCGTMVIRFLSYENRIAKGYLKTIYYDRLFYFTGLDHLLLIMQDIMDAVNFPQLTRSYRSLRGEKFEKQTDILKSEDDKKYLSLFEERVIPEGNLTDKFIRVQVLFRRNSSMQGQIKIGTELKQYFGSALEMIRLIYEYLEE